MAKVRIKLPKDILQLPEKDRNEIIDVLTEAVRLPEVMSAVSKGGDEHNMWSRNGDTLLADTEDQFYEELITPVQEMMAEVFIALDLTLDGITLQKSQDKQYLDFLENALLKSKNNGKARIKDLIELNRAKRDKFMKYIQDSNPFSKKQMDRLQKLMKDKLPDYAKKAEVFMVRAGLLAKIRGEAEKEAFSTAGAFVDRFPQTIQASEKQGVVLTLREKERAEAQGKKVQILPLTKQESHAVKVATHHAGDKLTEISERHMAGVRQLVIRAQRERWNPQKLAQELFDAYGDQNRDWRRVAITELAMATNDAYIQGVPEGETVVGMGAENACQHCKKLVIGKTFTVTHGVPKNTHHHEMNFVWAGKSNYGRRVYEYIPCVPLHPNCRCRWHRISRFYKVVDGKTVLKTTAELINEERVKRGMKPDPNLK